MKRRLTISVVYEDGTQPLAISLLPQLQTAAVEHIQRRNEADNTYRLNALGMECEIRDEAV